MDECIDSLVKAAVLSTLGANISDWHVEVEENDCNQTAFTSRRGVYRFVRMSFGLENAP